MSTASASISQEQLNSLVAEMQKNKQWDANSIHTLTNETDMETAGLVALAFRDNLKQALETVQAQKREFNFEEISRLAHRVKSSSKMLGFNDLNAISASIEAQFGAQKSINTADIDSWLQLGTSVMHLIGTVFHKD